ncbi:hypothetical protein DERP_009495 [Dermatophagoides pteronyssinus]|uniref:Serine-rich adhesin for platelets-like n=1 Tax=Dermatophagoides pteronyssinus TaxID=6956 RepID=A0ABQ8IUB5_DERPT|nr:hypothetical protein DERP_009495 [Dermatophagoides pteronyssinus]
MDQHNRYLSHHRQSLRPGQSGGLSASSAASTASSMLASRYGLSLGTNTGTTGLKRASVSCGSSPIRSRSNSTSRFKAAAAVAVAAATGNKHHHSSASRKSIVPGSLSFTSSTSSSIRSQQPLHTTIQLAGGGAAAGISSQVVSFMKKFVNKASPINQNSGDSIDQSFEQYQKSLQQQQQQRNSQQQQQNTAQSPTKYLFQTITGGSSAGSSSSASFGGGCGQTNIVDTNTNQINSPTSQSTTYLSSSSSPSTTSTLSTTNATNANNTFSPLVPMNCLSSQTQQQQQIQTTTSPTGSMTSVSTISTMIGVPSGGGYEQQRSSTTNMTSSGLNNSTNSSLSSSPISGPLFSKIRAKVASTFQQQQQQQQSQQSSNVSANNNFSNQNSNVVVDNINNSSIQQQQDMMMDFASKSRNGSISLSSTTGAIQPAVVQAGTPVQSSSTGGGYQRAPMLAMIHSSQSSSLTNEQLTAHLTEEERQILQKVWQKEEEFKEIALKNFAKNMSCGTEIIVETPTGSSGQLPSNIQQSSGPGSGPNAPGDVSHLSTNLLDPVAAAVHRRRSSAILSADATGFCRICRKVIMKNETSHRCSNCQELVCDDCSSYSSREESKYWMCSFCRRRGSHLVLVTTSGQTLSSMSSAATTSAAESFSTSSTSSKRQLSVHSTTTAGMASSMNNLTSTGMTTTTNGQQRQQQQFLTATPNALNAKRKLSWQETQQRPNSALEQFGQQQQQQNRQSSLDLNRSQSSLIKISNQQQEPTKFTVNQPQKLLSSSNLQQQQEQNCRTNRVYSLSDDEELWNDNGDDDDDDDDDDDVILKDNDDDDQNNQNQDNNNIEIIDNNNGTNNVHYGTLQSMPAEQLILKQQQQQHQGLMIMNSKKMKKKLRHHNNQTLSNHHHQYNSDDELLSNMVHNKENESLYQRTPPITITSLDGQPQSQTTIDPSSSSTVVHHQQQQQQNLSGFNIPSTDNSATIQSNNNNGVSYQQCQTKQAKISMVMPKIISVNGNSKVSGSSSISATHWWRLTNKARSLSRGGQLIGSNTVGQIGAPENFYTTPGIRKQLSSESSDYSDGFKYSPPQDSLTPSSDYSRSPRESADSDMLCLPGGYSMACRGINGNIPSVMIGNDDGTCSGRGSSFLSTKDCYLRRGSGGRALPKIPVVGGGSSMLDLPQSRKGSQHSLDIPADQPRRASAPESGADPIRIVINECNDLSASQMQLSTSSTKTPTNQMSSENLSKNASEMNSTTTIMAGKSGTPHPGPSIIQVPTTTTLQQRMRYQLSRAASITTHYERAILQRDKSDQSIRTGGFSLAITGGKLCELDGMLYAYITWTKPGGQADRQSLKSGDKILEWNGKSLVNCSHEQVANIMATAGDQVELIVESMTRNDQPAKYRRHSMINSKQSSSTTSTTLNESKQATSTSSSTTTATVSARPSSAAAVISTGSLDGGGGSSSSSTAAATTQQQQQQQGLLRRRLPQIPTAHQSGSTSTNSTTTTANSSSASSMSNCNAAALLTDAQIYLQVTIDANIRQLSVMIIQAKGLERHPIYAQNLGLEAYAQLRLLPEMGFKICQTELSSSFDWNETLIYHQFPLERIEKITLDLSIWCTNPATYIPGTGGGLGVSGGGGKPPRITISGNSTIQIIDHQLASTRIPLRSALLTPISEWWPLIPSNTDIQIFQQNPSITTTANTVNTNTTIPSLLNHQSNISISQQSLLNPSNHASIFSTATAISTTASNSSITPTVFFQKAPSMDHLHSGSRSGSGIEFSKKFYGQNGQLLHDQMLSSAAMMMMMTSRSTPGSRRNSNRSDQGDFPIFPSHLQPMGGSRSARTSPRMKASPTPPPVSNWFTRYRSSPTSRASSTVSSAASSTGRHSLDESYTSHSGGGGGGREGNIIGSSSRGISLTGSLRLAQNRHSIGNLYPVGPANNNNNANVTAGYITGTMINDRMQSQNFQHLSTAVVDQQQQSLAMRRKSSSALVHVDQGSKNQLSVPGGGGGYSKLSNTSDSYQYLLEPSNSPRNTSVRLTNANDNSIEIGDDHSDDQEEFDDEIADDTSDDDEDFDNLLKDSSYTLDSLENKQDSRNSPQKLQQKILAINNNNDETTNQTLTTQTTNQLNAPNTLALPSKNIPVNDVETSGGTSSAPPTPSHDDYDDDDNSQNGGGLTIPGCQERRPSFLRRLVPSAAETVMHMVMGTGGPGSNAQPSDEILHSSSMMMTTNTTTTTNAQYGQTTHPQHSEQTPKRIVKVVGEIKLGFIMTKGFLEIEVCAARGLPDSTTSIGQHHPPDTYVKTYLIDRGRQLYKRKTHVVLCNNNPQYRQTLKYDASIIYGRTLLVSVWEKQRRRHTFDANIPIGSVEINVNQLQLHKLTIRWFKLRTIVTTTQQQQSNNSTARNSLVDGCSSTSSNNSVPMFKQQDSIDSNDPFMPMQPSSSSLSTKLKPTITIDDDD